MTKMTEQKKARSTRTAKIPDYDSAWKTVIENHFEPFVQFFFPDIHQDIDFSIPPKILSKELKRIVPTGKVGKRNADVLVQVYLKDGTPKCICVFIHIEVQSTRKPGLMERIFIYYYRIFEKYREQGADIISLVILTDEDLNYRPNEYYFKRWGFEHRMTIPMVKIIDYKHDLALQEKLKTSKNPMALAVKVQLKSHEARQKDNQEKFDVKRELIRELYLHGYDKSYIRSFLDFVDLIFRLPESLERKISEEIINIEEDQQMAYVTSWERIARKDGKKEGKREGKREGKLEGKREGIREGIREGKLKTAVELLKNGVDISIIVKSTGLTRKEIEKAASVSH